MKALLLQRQTWMVLAVVGIIQLLSWPRETYPGDPLAMREESRAILEGHLHVPEELASRFGDQGQFFVKNERNGLYYSKYGWMNSLLFVPPLLLERIVEGSVPAMDSPHRVTYLNFNHWLWTLALAFFLWALSGEMSENFSLRAFYVGFSLFGTFSWNYLRAQSSEVFQMALYAALSWIVFRRIHRKKSEKGEGWLYVAWSLILALTGVRIVFAVMAGVLGLLCVFLEHRDGQSWEQSFWGSLRRNFLPGVLFLGVLAGMNWLKFGSPQLTGYHVWRPEIHGFSGDLTESLYGLLFHVHWSVFVHFPLLIFAAWGAIRWGRRYSLEYGWAWGTLALYLLIIGKIPSWRGEACYGPRYFLFALTVASVAVLPLWESWLQEKKAIRHSWRWRGVFVVFLWSLFLQEQTNRRTFMAFYKFRDSLFQTSYLTARYFEGTHPGRVNWDFARAHGDFSHFDFWKDLAKIYDPRSLSAYQQHLTEVASSWNYYWF